jgi:serine protease Do
VLALGSPLALSQSVTRGIVSNAKMTMPTMFRRFGGFAMEGEDVGALVRWIAHDAPIYPGNSGGPLVNMRGEVVGVNEISMGLGGAIPANLAHEVADQIIAHGHVSRSWLGIGIQPLLKGSGRTNGVFVSDVIEGSPAGKAGLKSDDILLSLAGHPVTVRFDDEIPVLNLTVAAIPPGQAVPAVVLRDGKELTLTVKMEEREQTEFKQDELKQWGMTVKNISFMGAKERKLDSREGVLVTSVRPGGPCGEAKPVLEPEDVIKTVAGKPVRNTADIAAITEELTKGKKAPVPTAVEFIRNAEKYLTVVKVGIRELEDPGLEARKAWLPVAVQVITSEIAQQLGTNGVTGVRITQVYTNAVPGGIDLKVGDLIFALDNESIPASQPGDEEVFFNRIRQFRVGDNLELSGQRDGKPLKVIVKLERTPKLEREMKKFQDHNFEFSARDLSFFDRVHDELPDDTTGALITDVKDGGWAALGEMQANDIVQSIDDAPIADVAALEAKMKALGQSKSKFVVLRVLRGIHIRYLELEPNWETVK